MPSFYEWPLGASNFLELALATAKVLYGPDSAAFLATVVGVLVEVSVVLAVCRVCVATKHWFDSAPSVAGVRRRSIRKPGSA